MQCLIERWSRVNTMEVRERRILEHCVEHYVLGGKNTARFFCLPSCPILAWVAVITSNTLVLKSNRFGSMFLDKFKLQRINFSPTRAGSLHEKGENDWKNSTNSHFLRDVFLGSYGRALFLLNFHYVPYKKSYCIHVGNPEATSKALC